MSYSQHFLFAMDLSNKLFKGSIQSLIHGIFPNFYETSTTDLIKEIDDKDITTRSMIFKFILYYPSKNLFLAFLTAFKTFFGAVPP